MSVSLKRYTPSATLRPFRVWAYGLQAWEFYFFVYFLRFIHIIK